MYVTRKKEDALDNVGGCRGWRREEEEVEEEGEAGSRVVCFSLEGRKVTSTGHVTRCYCTLPGITLSQKVTLYISRKPKLQRSPHLRGACFAHEQSCLVFYVVEAQERMNHRQLTSCACQWSVCSGKTPWPEVKHHDLRYNTNTSSITVKL